MKSMIHVIAYIALGFACFYGMSSGAAIHSEAKDALMKRTEVNTMLTNDHNDTSNSTTMPMFKDDPIDEDDIRAHRTPAFTTCDPNQLGQCKVELLEICREVNGGIYRCLCPENISRAPGGKCTIFNECFDKSSNNCAQDAECIDEEEGFTCRCKDGFRDASPNPAMPGRVCVTDPLGFVMTISPDLLTLALAKAPGGGHANAESPPKEEAGKTTSSAQAIDHPAVPVQPQADADNRAGSNPVEIANSQDGSVVGQSGAGQSSVVQSSPVQNPAAIEPSVQTTSPPTSIPAESRPDLSSGPAVSISNNPGDQTQSSSGQTPAQNPPVPDPIVQNPVPSTSAPVEPRPDFAPGSAAGSQAGPSSDDQSQPSSGQSPVQNPSPIASIPVETKLDVASGPSSNGQTGQNPSASVPNQPVSSSGAATGPQSGPSPTSVADQRPSTDEGRAASIAATLFAASKNGNTDPNSAVDEKGEPISDTVGPPPPTDELKNIFKIFDLDGNDQVSFWELKASVDTFSLRISDKDVVKMIKFADSSGEGMVDFNEFRTIMTSRRFLRILL